MRKITREARAALLSRTAFSKDNTCVGETSDGEWAMWLHGNEIVRLHADDTISVCDGGYWGSTTKERLNAFTSVHQSKHVPHLMGVPWNGRWVNVSYAEPARAASDVNARLGILRALAAERLEETEADNRAKWVFAAWKLDGDVEPPVADYFRAHFTG